VDPQGDEGGVLFFLEIADLIETCVGLVNNFYFISKGEILEKVSNRPWAGECSLRNTITFQFCAFWFTRLVLKGGIKSV
jgi:hypothetical protein